MTGNSMDAVDVVLTEFSDGNIRDVCGLSVPYSVAEKREIDALRKRVVMQKIPADVLIKDWDFLRIHQKYVEGIANAVNELCRRNDIDKKSVQAIGFHGKTLDHNPPSLAKLNGTQPFTTQMGSAQLLADLTDIPVINDFRSVLLMNGFEGAPLAAPHNAHIAKLEGDGCYINAGNTANLAWIKNGAAQISWDAGPFNEYIDSFVLRYKNIGLDKNAEFGKKGTLQPELVDYLFALCRDFYELEPPKSGDPAFYKTEKLFAYVEEKYGNPAQNEQVFCDVLHTLEFFAGYLTAYAAAATPENIKLAPNFVLFGGGWKNPLARQSFEDVLSGRIKPLPQHIELFNQFRARLSNCPAIKYSEYGEFMEARLFADLARCYLEQKSWKLPELENSGKSFVLGYMRLPHKALVDDYLSRAARGWQNKINV